jgi:hypothetical protein
MCVGYFYLIRAKLPAFDIDVSTNLVHYQGTIPLSGQTSNQIWARLQELIAKFGAIDKNNLSLSPWALLMRPLDTRYHTFECPLRGYLYENVRRFRKTQSVRVGEVQFTATFQATDNRLSYTFTNFQMRKGGDNPFDRLIDRVVATDQDYAYYLEQVDRIARDFIDKTSAFMNSNERISVK